MGQDLRKLFEEQRKTQRFEMKAGHEDRFLERLDEALPVTPKARPTYLWLRIAAAVVVLLGVGTFFLLTGPEATQPPNTTVVTNDTAPAEQEGITLGDLSPDLEKVENYYVASINYELSRLQISDDNKGLVDGYLEQLGLLNEEYKTLNEELNTMGPNDETISALIKNLQLRLQLLQNLKEKLNQLKSSENEQETTII